MKIEKMMRVPLMLAAMAAGLVFVKPVYAQQEMDPTVFQAAADQNGAGFNQPVAAEDSTAVAAQPVDEASMASAASFDMNAVLGLTVGATVIVLLGIAESVKGSRRRTWKNAGTNAWAKRVTAN